MPWLIQTRLRRRVRQRSNDTGAQGSDLATQALGAHP